MLLPRNCIGTAADVVDFANQGSADAPLIPNLTRVRKTPPVGSAGQKGKGTKVEVAESSECLTALQQ